MKYRVNTTKNILGDEYFCVEEKHIFGCWWYVAKSLTESFEEADALKQLLEMGISQYSIFKPSARLAMYKAGKTNILWDYKS